MTESVKILIELHPRFFWMYKQAKANKINFQLRKKITQDKSFCKVSELLKFSINK